VRREAGVLDPRTPLGVNPTAGRAGTQADGLCCANTNYRAQDNANHGWPAESHSISMSFSNPGDLSRDLAPPIELLPDSGSAGSVPGRGNPRRHICYAKETKRSGWPTRPGPPGSKRETRNPDTSTDRRGRAPWAPICICRSHLTSLCHISTIIFGATRVTTRGGMGPNGGFSQS